MNKSTSFSIRKRVVGFLAFAGLFSLNAIAQPGLVYNNGALIWTGPNSIVHINGVLENNSATANGDIDHNGDMRITKNSTNALAGDVILNNNSLMQGDGITHVEQDWINNANFQADLSEVELYGNTQEFITGTNITTFHDLTLTGTGAGINRHKTQTLNAIIDATGIMNINDRVLETQTNTIFVMNPSTAAVDNDSLVAGSEGFVMSSSPGVLHRETNATASYVYPVGSDAGTLRYRPVRIVPQAVTATYYDVRFINNDPNLDGFLRTSNDGSMCETIDLFYHIVDHPAAPTPANISIYYKNAADNGSWNDAAHWRDATAATNPNMWNDMTSIVASTANGFDVDTRGNWLFANPGIPYLLTRMRPTTPTITCQDMCAFMQGSFTVTSPGTGPYVWTTTSGTITSGQGTGTINVTWGGTSGTVTVIDTSFGALCASQPATCTVNMYPQPLAAFDTTASGFSNNVWNFTDLSSITAPGNIVGWYWDFGDGSTSTLQNPIHNYSGAGSYSGFLIVTSANGCLDTIPFTIYVDEGILIPNVFTPNGDGMNDVFYIPNSGVEEYKIQIFNRWGTKIFEAEAPEIRWDGRSTSGVELSDGTYYYILHAVMKPYIGTPPPGYTPLESDQSKTGFVELLRQKGN